MTSLVDQIKVSEDDTMLSITTGELELVFLLNKGVSARRLVESTPNPDDIFIKLRHLGKCLNPPKPVWTMYG